MEALFNVERLVTQAAGSIATIAIIVFAVKFIGKPNIVKVLGTLAALALSLGFLLNPDAIQNFLMSIVNAIFN